MAAPTLERTGFASESASFRVRDPQDISSRFEKILFGRLLDRLVREMAHDFNDLDQRLQITRSMIERQLDIEIKRRLDYQECFETYNSVAGRVVEEFFGELIQQHGVALQE